MRRPILLLLLLTVLLCLLRTELLDFGQSPLEAAQGSVQHISGRVCSVKIKDYGVQFAVRTRGEKLLVKLNGDYTGCCTQIYDMVGRRIECSGEVSLPDGRRNPGCFDYRTYLRGRGIRTVCTTNSYKIKGGRIVRPVMHFLSLQKARFYAAIRPLLSEDDFSLLAGLMFGETFYMNEELYAGFQGCGIAHILAVSGLHVGLMFDAVSRLFRGRRNKSTDAAALLLILLYAALSNFSVSVLRATIMIFLKMLAFHLQKRYDSVSAASAAAILLLLCNPYLLYDSGMQLSFTAAFTMGIVLPWAENKWGKLSDRVKSERFYKCGKAALPTLCAFAGTGPLCAYQFLMFSPISILLNPPVIALAGILLPLALASFVLFCLLPGAISGILLPLLTRLLALFCRLLFALSEAGTHLFPDSRICAPPLGLVLLYYIFFFFFFSEIRYILHRRNRYALLVCVQVLLLSAGTLLPRALNWTNSVLPWDYGVAPVTFLDVGQGDCIHIHYGGKDILIDGGGSYYANVAEKTLKPYLLKNGIHSIDLAIITHEDMDHSKGITELNEIFDIKKILTNHDVYSIQKGEENDLCLVLSAEIEGLTFLFMSDADIAREEELLQIFPDLSCDVLKIGHHGSAGSTGEAFLSAVSPSFAAISCGQNNRYGHPAGSVIELLENSGIIYGRTDRSGALCLRKVTDRYYIFENAAKDKQWRIPRTLPQSTPLGPS